MKRILSYALILFTINCFSVSYTTVAEECTYIRFSGNTLQDIVVDKSQVKLQKTTSKVSVVFLSGGSQTLNWDASQARSYGYSLDSLYDFILGKLMVQCDTSGGGVSQSALNDSIAALRSIRKVDSIYKKATNRDLTYFKVNGVEYSVKDSVGSGGGGSVSVSNGLIDTLGDIQLGGELNRPTEIVLNDNNFTFYSLRQPSFGSGLGLYMGHSVYGSQKSFGIANFNGTWLNSITNTVETNTGTTLTQLGITNFATGYNNQIRSKYSTSKDGELFWEIREDNGNSVVKLKADEREFGDRCAFRIVPTSPYIGDVVFDVKSNSTDAFQVRTNGDVRFVVPTDTTVTILYGKDSLGNLVETNIIGQIRNEIADTSAVLRGLITNSGTVTSVATGIGLSGGTITNSGTIIADTTVLSTKNYALNIGNNKATFSALNDSITAVRAIRKVDTLYRNSDSIVFKINGIRYSIKDSTGGGGVPLSSITAATATNNISNTNYKQRWNWNTIAGDTAFVLESVSTTAASNLQNVFTVKTSGANATSTQTTYAQRISNTHTGTSSTNVGLDITASGATNNYALLATGRVGIGVSAPSYALDVSGDIRTSSTYRFSGVSTILEANGGLNLTGSGVIISSSNVGGAWTGYQFRTIGSDLISQTSLNMPTVGSRFSIAFGTSYINGSYLKLNANPAIIENSSGNIIFYSNTGLTVDATGYTPTEIIRFKSDGSIGVGTNSPAASAKLDLTSTTQGFLPPRMTATQASAISSPAKALMIYVTDTNGTFTSAGWWGYNGTIWKLILAE